MSVNGTTRFRPRFNPHAIPESVRGFAQWGGYMHGQPGAWNVNSQRPPHPFALGQCPETWAPFDLAVARRRALGLDGVCFLSSPDHSPFLFVTLHEAVGGRNRDRANRTAFRAVAALDTYVEVAPNRDDLTVVFAAADDVIGAVGWTGELRVEDMPYAVRLPLASLPGPVTVWPLAFATPLTGDVVLDPGVRDLGSF